MAHDVESAFFVRTPAWHRLGVVLPEAPNVREAIRHAGLDWSVRLDPVAAVVNGSLSGTGRVLQSDIAVRELKSHRAVVRTRDDASPHRQRDPQIRCGASLFAEESGRRDAGNGEGRAADPDDSIDHGGIAAQPSLPPRVAHDRDRMCAWCVVIRGEGAAQHRVNAERRKVGA